jgi:hypothetical protein
MKERTVRQIHAGDLFRRSLFGLMNGKNLAITRDRIAQTRRWSLSPRNFLYKDVFLRRRHVWVGVDGQIIWGLVSARRRLSSRVFELDRFYLSPGAEDLVAYLMERVGTDLSREGVQKIFLRARTADPFMERVDLGGFLPVMAETLYWRNNDQSVVPNMQRDSPYRLRPIQPIDALDCFHLYNAVTPLAVRSSYAVTLKQWRDATDYLSGSVKEFVYESEKGIRGWLRISARTSQVHFDLVVHPDEIKAMFPLVQSILESAGAHVGQYCIAPSYAISLRSTLEHCGFSPSEEFKVLAKSMTVRVKIPRLASVAIG